MYYPYHEHNKPHTTQNRDWCKSFRFLWPLDISSSTTNSLNNPMSRQPTKWPTSHLVFNLVRCFATARYHKMVHLTSCFQFGQMLCYRQVPQNGPPHILFWIWSNALLPPGTTKRSTSRLVFNVVKCFATARGPQNGPPHILFSIWSNAVLPPGNTTWTSKTYWINMVSKHVVLLWSFHWKTTFFVQQKAPPRMPTPRVKKTSVLACRCSYLGHRGLLI